MSFDIGAEVTDNALIDRNGITRQFIEQVTPLVQTDTEVGEAEYADTQSRIFDFGSRRPDSERTLRSLILAVRIEGAKDKIEDGKKPIHAIVVADTDCVAPNVIQINRHQEFQTPVELDNGIFLWNILDSLAGDDQYLDVRARRSPLPLPTKVELDVQEQKRFVLEDFGEAVAKIKHETARKLQKQYDEMVAKANEPNADRVALQNQLQAIQLASDQEARKAVAEFEKIRDRRLRQVETKFGVDKLELFSTKLDPTD